MRFLKKMALGLAVASAAVAPIAASAAPFADLRALSVFSEESEAEGSTGIIIGVVAAAAVIGGIVVISDDDGPSSP